MRTPRRMIEKISISFLTWLDLDLNLRAQGARGSSERTVALRGKFTAIVDQVFLLMNTWVDIRKRRIGNLSEWKKRRREECLRRTDLWRKDHPGLCTSSSWTHFWRAPSSVSGTRSRWKRRETRKSDSPGTSSAEPKRCPSWKTS